MTVRLDGKVALITGASAGIGRGIALAMAARGAKVLGVARREGPGLELERQIAAEGGSFTYVAGDVTSRADCERAVDTAVEQHGRLDILINNAGHGLPLKRLEAFEDEDWRAIMAVDLEGAFYTIRHALPIMQKQRDGVIINIASIVGSHAVERYGVYGAAKAATSQLTRAVAVENLQYGIRANTIEMGAVATDHVQDVFLDMGKYIRGQDWEPAPAGGNGDGIMAQGVMDPESVGRAVAVLCSDDAREITGASISIDRCFGAGILTSSLLYMGAAQLLPS